MYLSFADVNRQLRESHLTFTEWVRKTEGERQALSDKVKEFKALAAPLAKKATHDGKEESEFIYNYLFLQTKEVPVHCLRLVTAMMEISKKQDVWTLPGSFNDIRSSIKNLVGCFVGDTTELEILIRRQDTPELWREALCAHLASITQSLKRLSFKIG